MADSDGFVNAYDSANHGRKVRVPEHFVGENSPFPNLRETPLSRSTQAPTDGETETSKEK